MTSPIENPARKKIHEAISVIIVVNRLDMTLTSEQVATLIIDKFIQSGWTYDARCDHS